MSLSYRVSYCASVHSALTASVYFLRILAIHVAFVSYRLSYRASVNSALTASVHFLRILAIHVAFLSYRASVHSALTASVHFLSILAIHIAFVSYRASVHSALTASVHFPRILATHVAFVSRQCAGGWVDPVRAPPLLRESGSAENRTQGVWLCSQELPTFLLLQLDASRAISRESEVLCCDQIIKSV
jgi:hypothetical protein